MGKEPQAGLPDGWGLPVIEDELEAWIRGHSSRCDLPYEVRTYDLTAADNDLVEFEGNTINVIDIQGVSPLVQCRIHRAGNARIPLRDLMEIKHDYSRIYLDWEAIAGGSITILFGVDLNV